MPAPIGRRARIRRGDDGAAAVEFALVSVLLFALLFGVLQYGLFFFQLGQAQDTLRTAARQVEIGEVAACAAWRQEVIDGSPVEVTSVTWETKDDASVAPGTAAIAQLAWRPTRIAGGLIPFPDGEQTLRQPLVLDRVGATESIWDADLGLGCPD